MKFFVFSLVACWVASAGFSYAGQEGTVYPGVIEPGKEVDARVWLHTPHPGNDFADKKGMSRREAERLVDRLYDAGALSVTMVFLMGEAEGFRVRLPLNADLRRDVIGLINGQRTRAGLESLSDSGQESVVIWLK